MKITGEIRGERELKRTLRRMPLRGRDLTRPFKIIGVFLVGRARRRFELEGPGWIPSQRVLAGKGTRTLRITGNLMNSIYARARRDQLAIGSAPPASAYAKIHQFGGRTPPHIIRPRRAKVLRFEKNGRVIFAKSVQHPGSDIPARPFIVIEREDRKYIKRKIGQHLLRG